MPAIVAERESTPTDEELLARGDSESFRLLYERHYAMIYHTAWRVTGNASDAEELAQETFLTAFQEAKTFERRARFTTWLTRIVLNKSINLTNQRRGRLSLLRRFFGRPSDSEPPAKRDGIQELLDRVAPQHRAVLTLRYVLGLSYEEVAQALDCPVGTAKSRLFKAHLAVRGLQGETDEL